jgi:hypothetical protein
MNDLNSDSSIHPMKWSPSRYRSGASGMASNSQRSSYSSAPSGFSTAGKERHRCDPRARQPASAYVGLLVNNWLTFDAYMHVVVAGGQCCRQSILT